MRTVVLDNGAHSIKALDISNAHASKPEVYANSVTRSKQDKRNYVADEIDDCLDFGNLTFRRPFELVRPLLSLIPVLDKLTLAAKGILNNWDVEKVVWDRVFGSKGRGLKLQTKETRLAVTEPVLNLPNVQDHYDQILFEEYDFAAVLRCPAPCFVPFAHGAELAVVVDAGFSFTHVVPLLNGRVIADAVRRIDIGGKMLTNYLKELVSYRHLYMMDQTSAVEHMKEIACYAATDYALETRKAGTVRTYVLPDFVPTSKNKLGYLLPKGVHKVTSAADGGGGDEDVEEEQLLHLDRERYQVPELLFNPSSIGIPQMGLAEALAESISVLPTDLQGLAWSNVILTGGTSLTPGFKDRLVNEVRPLAPAEFSLSVTLASDPVCAPVLAFPQAQGAFKDDWMARQDYHELGSSSSSGRRKQNKIYLSSIDGL